MDQLKPLILNLESKGIGVSIDTSITQEPSFADFENLLQKVIPKNPDIIIGIGGGSVLDIAKLIAAQLDNTQQLRDYVGINLLNGRKKKLICIPATSGPSEKGNH
jgi:alcohol dehydrogenase class IV